MKIKTLIGGDIKSIFRDTMLWGVLPLPILITFLFRSGIPLLREWLLPWFDLQEHYLFICSFLISITQMLLGIVISFIVVEEKEYQLISLYSVTPLTRRGYLIYRIFLPAALSFINSTIIYPLSGLAPIKWPLFLPVALLITFQIPVMTLFIGAFAENRVEAMALGKVYSITYMAPFIGYFWKSPYQLAAGISPPYWSYRTFMAIYRPEEGYLLSLLAGIVVSLLLIKLFYHFFSKKVG